MTDSNKANDLNDRKLNAATQLDSNASLEPETQNTESLNIDDIDLETLERLTKPDANSTMSEPNSQDNSTSQSMIQATLSGNSYSMAHSNYIAEDSHFEYENDLSKQALSNVSDNNTEEIADDLCADDIALAVSNFNSPSSTIGASTVSSQKDQNNTENSSLGASADLEVSNMLQESEPSQDNATSKGVDVTMPQEEEPRLKIYDTPSSDDSQEGQSQAMDSQSPAAIEAEAQTSDSDKSQAQEDISNVADESLTTNANEIDTPESGVMKGATMLDTSTAISGSTERVVTPVEQSSSSRTMTPEELAMIAQAGSAFSRSANLDASANASESPDLSFDNSASAGDSSIENNGLVADESIEVPEKGVMKGAKMLDTSTAISGIEERVVTPVEQSSSSRTMSAEELAMIAQAGSAFSRSASLDASDSESSSESAGDNQGNDTIDNSGLVVDESIEVPEKGVMKGAKMLDTSTAISGIEERVITPVEQSSSSRTISAEELAMIAQAGSAFSRSASLDASDSASDSDSNSDGDSQGAGAGDNSGLVVDESIEVPEKGVMKGAKMLDTSTAISGIEERVITPVEQSTSSRTMTPEELAIIAMAGGSTPKSPTSGMTPLTIEPRENDLFHQTGSSNIARDINSIQSGSTTNLFKDATVMEEGHTAIVGLDNRMVASETPDTSTVITGLSASYIDQIQAVNEMAARQNQEYFEAKAKFEEEMAAEQAQAAMAQELAQAHGQSQGLRQGQEQGLGNEAVESYDNQGNLDYSLYDGIADPNYHKEEPDYEANDGEQPYYDNSDNYYEESQDALVKNTNDNPNYYDYSQYDESEVQAMPTDMPEKEDDGPNYVVGVHENFNAEAAAKSNQQEDNPYSYGTYANKLAHQNAMRQNPDQEIESDFYGSAMPDQDDFTSADETNNVSEPQEEAPLYYGTYASRLAQENALRNKNKVNTPPRYQSPAEFEQNERARAKERALAKERAMAEANLEPGFDQELNEEHHSPEPSGMGDGALSQLNLKNSIEPDDGPKYYMSKDKLANKANQDDGPVYLVGVKRNKGELNAQRSKIIHDESLESYEAMPTPEEEAAYMKELADAARESMAAPNSEVVKRARMLASQGEQTTLDEPNGALLEGNEANNLSSNPELFDGVNNAQATDAEANGLMAANAEELANSATLNPETTNQELTSAELKQKQLNANQRKEEDGNYNFSNMTIKDNVGFGMMIFLYIRQLIASFFSHTTLPLIAPNLSKNLGQSYPSSMPIPFFFVGLIAGAIGSILHSTIELDYVGSISYLIYLLLTGLTAYRGIHRICAFISRKWKRDSVLSSASVMVPMLIFIWLANTLIVKTDGIVEATASFAIASMMAAATASSLTWNFPQDPMDSIGNMSTKGLLFVIILSIMASFGLLHYTVGLSVFGVSILVRLIFGYFIAKNQGTANRPYVYALQLITLFAILFDMILLKSQNYDFLSKSSLELVAYLRHYSHFF